MTVDGTEHDALSLSAERHRQGHMLNNGSNMTASYANNPNYMTVRHDEREQLLRSSSQFKQLISQIQQDNKYMLLKGANSPLVDTSNSIESKFDTPGPGSYNIKGYFYKKERRSSQIAANKQRGDTLDTLLTTSGTGTERSIS